MIEVIVFFLIFLCLQELLIDVPARRSIKKSSSAGMAISVRDAVKTRRKHFLFISIICFYVYSLSLSFVFSEKVFNLHDLVYECIKLIIADAIVFFWYFVSIKASTRHLGNISTSSKESFLNNYSRFVLYLRGFECDDYSKKHHLKKKGFSEYQMVRLLKGRIQVCAVGMTKELDSPDGAIRVYVSDSTWKDDVRELMDKSESIYILVNDRPSCLWEIEQSAELKSKTVYLVDNVVRYLSVQSKLSNVLDFPSLPYDSNDSVNYSISFIDGRYVVNSFSNTIEGYSNAIGGDAKMLAYKDNLRKRLKYGWIIVFISPLVVYFPPLLLLFVPMCIVQWRKCENTIGEFYKLNS